MAEIFSLAGRGKRLKSLDECERPIAGGRRVLAWRGRKAGFARALIAAVAIGAILGAALPF